MHVERTVSFGIRTVTVSSCPDVSGRSQYGTRRVTLTQSARPQYTPAACFPDALHGFSHFTRTPAAALPTACLQLGCPLERPHLPGGLLPGARPDA